MEDDIAYCVLTVEERGTKMRDDFCFRMDPVEKERQLFFDPIKRAPWKSITDQSLKSKVRLKSEEKERDVTVQRDILGLLATKSQEAQTSVDINKALQYSLSPIPLCLATSDGTRRKTAKSTLFGAALFKIEVDSIHFEQTERIRRCYILDLSAIMRRK
eukprot:gene7270-12957_t